jgi:hypothetical protein
VRRGALERLPGRRVECGEGDIAVPIDEAHARAANISAS